MSRCRINFQPGPREGYKVHFQKAGQPITKCLSYDLRYMQVDTTEKVEEVTCVRCLAAINKELNS